MKSTRLSVMFAIVVLILVGMTTRLRTVREAQGLSLRELARRTGLDVAYLSRVERSRQSPSVRSLILISHELGLRDTVNALKRLTEDDGRGD